MKGFLIRWGIHAVALWVASLVVSGIRFPGDPPSILQVVAVAALFGLVNAVVRPIVAFASCGLYVLTLGLFHFIVNGFMLWVTAWLAGPWLEVDGFWAAFLGALVVSIVGTLLTALLDPGEGDGKSGVIVVSGR